MPYETDRVTSEESRILRNQKRTIAAPSPEVAQRERVPCPSSSSKRDEFHLAWCCVSLNGSCGLIFFKEKPLVQCWAAVSLVHAGGLEIMDSVAVRCFSRALSDGRYAFQSDSCFLLCCNMHNLPHQQGAMFHVSTSIWYESNLLQYPVSGSPAHIAKI